MVMATHGALGVAVGLARFNGIALVDHVLALGKTNLHLHLAAHEIHLEWNNGQPLFADLPVKARDFLAVQQQLAFAGLVVVENIAVVVGLDGAANQPGFHMVVDVDIALLDTDVPLLDGFYLGTRQHNARFDLFQYMVIALRLPVGGQHARTGTVLLFFIFSSHWIGNPKP